MAWRLPPLAALVAALLPWRSLQATAADSTRDARSCAVRVTSVDRAALWAPPLDRIITTRVPEGSVREALDQVARVAQLELSYSAELLPRERRVCLTLTQVPVGAVIESLLDGTALRAIVLGSTQVVLAPSPNAPREATDSLTGPMARRASVLDRVVVTGSPDGAAQRGSPFALDVIDGATLAQHGVRRLGDALDLAVPGMWSWTAAAGSVTARYGSIRGASSFGVTAPKIYLDGIEVANPLLVTQLDPARVARVEVIRGPQGAALYGADAISGVINILTRHDGTSDGGTQLQLASAAGLSSTAFAARSPFVQDHALSLRRGTMSRSFGLGMNLGSVGAYVPGASEQRLLADADARVVRSRTVLTGTARFALQRANASSGLMFDALGLDVASAAGTGVLLDRRSVTGIVGSLAPDTARGRPLGGTFAVPGFAGDSATGQELAQYTLGGSLAVTSRQQWTHTVIAGVDGYRLQGLSSVGLPTSLAGSWIAPLGWSEGSADRGTLRYRAVGRFDLASGALLTMTLAAEQALMREVQGTQGALPPNALSSTTAGAANGAGKNQGVGASGPSLGTVPRTPVPWANGTPPVTYANSGVSAQAVYAWQDRLFASAGARVERTTGATPAPQQILLPMVGIAYVRDYGRSVLKWRGAYGTGSRPARTMARTASWMGRGAGTALAELRPEIQSGTEIGADWFWGSHVTAHVTRFDQLASGLIQPVPSLVTVMGSNGRLQRAMSYSLQNVGAITNRGWELEATARFRQLSLAATWSAVDSRVARTAAAYKGELRAGDRMLDVPARTASLSAGWTAGRLTLTTAATRAADWVGYDRAALTMDLASSTALPRDLEGAGLNRYWMAYDAVTRWRGSIAYRLRGDLAAVLNGDNLLNVQRGAPDNATVIVGRTLTFGLRTTF